MLRNYLVVALRNLVRHKLYMLINVFGLGIGFAGCLLIGSYLYGEVSFEKCHQNRDRIYRVAANFTVGNATIPMANIMPPVASALKEEFPEIKYIGRMRAIRDIKISVDDKKFTEDRIFCIEPAILDIFSFQMIKGDPAGVLNEPFTALISREAARKYFGDSEPMGRSLSTNYGHDLIVRGVYENLPPNTQIKSDILCSYVTLEKIENPADYETWMRIMTDYTYLILHEGADAEYLESKLHQVIDKNLDPDRAKMFTLFLQPLNSIYLRSKLSSELQPQGNLSYIYLFSGIAFLILLIACINYINLMTAKTAHRLKEVGVRKVLGAARSQLVRQFTGESILLCFISMILGLAVYEMVKPLLEAFIQRHLIFSVFNNFQIAILVIALTLLVGILAGSYPAFYFSGKKPVSIIKNVFIVHPSKSLLRKILVVFQFTAAIVLIFATLVIYRQLNYSITKDLGFIKDNLLIISLEGDMYGEKASLLKQEILNNNHVMAASAVTAVPGGHSLSLRSFYTEAIPEDSSNYAYLARGDADFMRTFGFTLIEGKEFSPDGKESVPNPIIINQTAIKDFNLGQAIGNKLISGGEEYTIIGVVKDFHEQTMHNRIMPAVIENVPDAFEKVAVRLYPDNIPEAISGIQKTWTKIFPDRQFRYEFLSDMIRDAYEAEKKIGVLFIIFSMLTIVIACLGILGLVSFSTQQRFKEIGIRKVLGASVTSIIQLINKEFIFLVIVANIVAWPTGYYAMNRWLENYAYRVNFSITTFLISGFLALFIALITISFQTIRAARANPVDVIKRE